MFVSESLEETMFYGFYELDISLIGPGYYWCEGFLYPGLTKVSSNKLFVQKEYRGEYVVILKLKNYVEKLSFYPLTRENIEMLQNHFQNEMPYNSSFYPRIFKINALDGNDMTLTFHLSSADSRNDQDEYKTLKNISQSQTTFEFVEFRSVSYCYTDVTNQYGQDIYWNITVTDQSKNPAGGFCVTDDGVILQRYCVGNFIDGYRWTEIGKCKFYSESDVSNTLIELTTSEEKTSLVNNLSDVLKLTEQYAKFYTIDVLMLANYTKAIASQKPDLEKVTGIISNIMKISQPVLYSAQQNFKATDTILLALDDILISSTIDISGMKEWKNDNLRVIIINIEANDFYGIFVKNCSTDLSQCEIYNICGTPITQSSFPDDLYAAVYISESLQQQILAYAKSNDSYIPKIAITIYYGTQLFVEQGAPKHSDLVFGVLLPDFPEEFQGPLTIYYYTNTRQISFDYNCSYWKFNKTVESSWQVEDSDNENTAILCNFYHLTHFAVPITTSNSYTKLPPVNYSTHKIYEKAVVNTIIDINPISNTLAFSNLLTGIKQNIEYTDGYCFNNFKMHEINYPTDNSVCFLNTCHSVSACELPNIFNYFCWNKNWTVKDIELLATTLHDHIFIIDAPALEILSEILDYIMKSHKDVIKQAQLLYRSADKILNSLDQILININENVEISEETLTLLVVSKEHSVYFEGFYITKEHKIQVLYKNQNKYKKSDNIVSLMFSSELLQHIREFPTSLAFAVFYDDSFFFAPGHTVVENVIVDVLFQHLKFPLKGSIIINYFSKLQYKERIDCSYWNYLVDDNVLIPGQWKKEFEFNEHISSCRFQHATHFALVVTTNNITTDLENILNSNLTSLEKINAVQQITDSSVQNLVPVDVSLISQIMFDSLSEGTFTTIASRIISNLFNVSRDILRQSQISYSATDIILHSIDEMAKHLDTAFINNKNFSLVVKNMQDREVKGIFISNCLNDVCDIDFLDVSVNISDYAANDSISAMVLFSDDLVYQINNSADSRIIVSLYHNDDLFNENNDDERTTSKIFGIIFPGLDEALEGPVSLIYNTGINKTSNNSCAYWHYNVSSKLAGQWQDDAEKQHLQNMTICSYTHVTHFGLLLANTDEYSDDTVLDIITDIGCISSLIGIIMILFTAAIFRRWRQNTGNIILINFSIAISLKIIMLYVSEFVRSTSGGTVCIISGALLHYSILSECAWMLTIAILQFKRFVEVLGGPPKYVLLKALVCGWVFPIIPVVCVVLIDSDSYAVGKTGLCYPSDLGMYLGVWLPVAIIVCINSVIFVFILYNVFHKKTEYIDTVNHEILFQWRLALLLFFMLGLTWLFGFLGQIKNDALFTYVFCITASLQGFVMFLFFIVFNKSTRLLYLHSAKHWFYSKGIFKVGNEKLHSKY
ncbi:uncharacterized protein LOC115880297 [Sitophilus oryzae]|uniref:Uncharacterized protein LOC115880297 n=1 Tax=Sitophilus oryzae TaxID=7048 RepID=A0A6J2XQJ2_SITOR|nr:uncharacterized protein LOC115880297 [Sitophilus oryzae]